MSDFLLEIGVENLPASYIQPAVAQLRDDFAQQLKAERLTFDDIEAAGTPRRLVVRVWGLAERQSAQTEQVTGPPVERSFDENGAPTKAAEGFARSLGVTVDKLAHMDSPKGKVLGLERKLPVRSTPALLKDMLPDMVAGVRFPKTMKWEPSGARFARPVRWIVALLGSKVVKFKFADVTSANVTYGRPWMRGEKATLRGVGYYDGAMKKLGVIVDGATREKKIAQAAEKAAASRGLSVIPDDGLISEIAYMTENPRVLVGDFEKKYLQLPPEVVRIAMKSHQRYLAVRKGRGKLMPHFITFTDGAVGSPAAVRKGNEGVLRARLEDAQFYFREDVSRGVDGLATELDRIVFIEGFGTIGEKATRMGELAKRARDLLAAVDSDALPDDAVLERITRIAKADLASEMIKDGKEFTKLQGLIGSYYAIESGESKEIADAIRQHYEPVNPASPLPKSMLATLVSIADRVDTITGCFLAGFVPSGSQDPYALRRHANGLFRIAETLPALDLRELFLRALELYRHESYSDKATEEKAHEAMHAFLIGRCEALLKERKYAYDVVAAVAEMTWSTPAVAVARARALTQMRGNAEFERLITGVKRVGNILPADKRAQGVAWSALDRAFDARGALNVGSRPAPLSYSTDAFESPAEKGLWEALSAAAPRVREHDNAQAFDRVLAELSHLADPIDAYFDEVLVNAKDDALRENRQNFLAVVFALFARYADFSKIVEVS